jgi:peptide deformylase
MKPIVQQGNPVLREVAKYIEPKDITSAKITSVIADMHAALATQKDGVALAAPQIGESLQIFVVSPTLFKKPQEHNLVYINPEIIEHSETKKWLEEGCLSCRWKLGQVERSLKVTIRANNEQGELFEEYAEGLLAHIFQHETDHLHGTLFVDKARNVRDMTAEEIKEVTG